MPAERRTKKTKDGKGKGRGRHGGRDDPSRDTSSRSVDVSKLPCWYHLYYHHFRDRSGVQDCRLGKECKRDHGKILSKADFLKLPVPPKMRGEMKKINKGDRAPTPSPKAKAKPDAKAKPRAKSKGRPTSQKPDAEKKRYPKIGKRYCWIMFDKGNCPANEKGECKHGEHIPHDEVLRLAEVYKAANPKDAAPASKA